MFEKLKQYFQKQTVPLEPELGPVIITIHGYGRRRQHEFDNLAFWGKADQLEIIQFDMYDLFDETDCNWKEWLQRAKDVVKEYKAAERKIYLVGFSMGGVIASYLAASYHVEKLILMAPAFNYINLDLVGGVLSKTYNSLRGVAEVEEIKLPGSFYSAFMAIVKNLKKYISDVECPVLLLHGDQDEVISLKSSIWAYDRIPHDQKKLLILHEGHHRLLMDEKVNWECYQLIQLFLKGEILHQKEIVQAVDIMDELIAQKRRMDQERALHEVTPGEPIETQEAPLP